MLNHISVKDFNRVLTSFVLVGAILYIGRAVLIPVTFSIFFAMLFTPMSNRMERAGLARPWTALISIVVLVAVTSVIGYMIYKQADRLVKQYPVIEKRSERFIDMGKQYVKARFKVSEKKQDTLMNQQVRSMQQSSGDLLKNAVSAVVGLSGACILVIIFTFLLLLQRNKYESFFLRLTKDTPPDEARKVIHDISRVAQSYLTGRVLSIIIFTVLFTTGFLIVGLESAFLLAFISALLTIVPYVGSIIGGLFPFAIGLVTAESSSVALGALFVVVIVQSVDNYFIEPYIIGGEVHINAFFTILILFIGGFVWGIAGMILFLPMLGVLKIIFDAIPALQPYGYLIGDQVKRKKSEKLVAFFKGLFRKKSQHP